MLINCGHRACVKFTFVLAVCLLACSSALTQAGRNPTAPSEHPPDKGEKIALRGCLGRSGEYFSLATATAEGWFVLSGQTSQLEKYIGRELTLEGGRGEDIPMEGFFKPFPSFNVDRIIEVFEIRIPKLNASFSSTSAWHTERSERYGVEFAHPGTMDAMQASESPLHSNFVTEEGAIAVSGFGIPGEAYLGTNLRGGFFAIFVNPNITNRPSCMQFAQPGNRNPASSPFVVGKLRYEEIVRGGAAMGAWDSEYYFHIFQNGVCYELAVELDEFSAHTADTGCNIPLLSPVDELNLIRPLIASVSFFRPKVLSLPAVDHYAMPQVTEFTASSQTADDVTNRGLITFSWTTQDADYVEFTYTCVDPSQAEEVGVFSVMISEDGPNRYCQNTPSFEKYSAGHFYRSPNASTNIGFGYFNHDDPTSVVVTITPFSHGVAFPASSKSLTVLVNPYNPFPRGVPTGTRNMTLAYAPTGDGVPSYAQGSLLTIEWTDERPQDPCVNLYLVQDNPSGGESYLLQINGKREIGCLKPATSGSYVWTVTGRYFGSGFRVLARTPGGASGTLGKPFNIVKPAPSPAQ